MRVTRIPFISVLTANVSPSLGTPRELVSRLLHPQPPIDRWLRFRMTESTAVAFKAMRRELSNLLVRKIEAPFTPTGELSHMLVTCLGRLLDIEAQSQLK